MIAIFVLFFMTTIIIIFIIQSLNFIIHNIRELKGYYTITSKISTLEIVATVCMCNNNFVWLLR